MYIKNIVHTRVTNLLQYIVLIVTHIVFITHKGEYGTKYPPNRPFIFQWCGWQHAEKQ